MRFILISLAIAGFIAMLFLFFTFFAILVTVVCMAGLLAWACGANINVTLTKNGVEEERVYRWFSRIK